MRAIRLLHVMTVSESFRLLEGQTRFMVENGIEVFVAGSPGPAALHFACNEPAAVASIEMTRTVTPIRDLIVVIRLCVLISRIRPDIVHAHTPKAGLLGMLASWLCRVPVRIYHLRGLPLETAVGWKRLLFKFTERVSCRLAHRVFCVSNGLRDVALREHLTDSNRIVVFFGGSGNGVDGVGAFAPSAALDVAGDSLRAKHRIPASATVIGFVGRLVRDKGIADLAAAWRFLRDKHPLAHLLLAGPLESKDALPEDLVDSLRADPRVHFTGLLMDARPVFVASDVIVHPSHREGFPNVPLEAAALERPVITTDASGCRESVLHGVTGLMVPVADTTALTSALERYLDDASLRERHGRAGRLRVLADFSQQRIWSAYLAEYHRLRSLVGADGNHPTN